MTTMLYKHPGKHKLHGDMFDHVITDDVDAAKKDGWFLTTPEALKASKAKTKKSEPIPNSAPDRAEVKQKADELGIKYASNIPTKKLQKIVEDKLDSLES